MTVSNPNRLSSAGPIDPANGFPIWFQDASGLRLELVTLPDPLAPAVGELPKPTAAMSFPDNFPDEGFYFMAEARLQVGGAGQIGRARVIMALEAAFGGDGDPAPDLGVVFARLRVRIDDVRPGKTYVVRHPYGETKELDADERGRVFYTCDLGVAEGNLARVLVSGQIAPFLVWAAGAPAGYIGDGATPAQVVNGPFRNYVEILGTGIGLGSADAFGPDMVTTDLFTVQGRLAGTGTGAIPPAGPAALGILTAEFRTNHGQFRVDGTVSPVSVPAAGGGFQANRVDVTLDGQEIGSAFADATGAWKVTHTLAGDPAPIGGTVRAQSLSGTVALQALSIRN